MHSIRQSRTKAPLKIQLEKIGKIRMEAGNHETSQ
jgi:hypothetical protein